MRTTRRTPGARPTTRCAPGFASSGWRSPAQARAPPWQFRTIAGKSRARDRRDRDIPTLTPAPRYRRPVRRGPARTRDRRCSSSLFLFLGGELFLGGLRVLVAPLRHQFAHRPARCAELHRNDARVTDDLAAVGLDLLRRRS